MNSGTVVASHKHPKHLTESAGTAAFEQFRPELRRFLRSRSRAQSADDLAQEVYLRLLRFPAQAVVEKPQAYLYRIASNVVHDFNLRAQQDQVTFDSPTVDSAAERIEQTEQDLAERLSLEEELRHVLAPLPKLWQAALVLRKRDGLSYPEIARELGVSVHAVKKYIARAVAQCRLQRRGTQGGYKP